MSEKINQFVRDAEMLSKSKITKQFKKEYPMFKDIPLSEIKAEFDDMEGKRYRTGMPNNKNRQRQTKYIPKEVFARKLFRRYFRVSRTK